MRYPPCAALPQAIILAFRGAWILRLAARLQGLAPSHCPLITLSFRRPRVQIAAFASRRLCRPVAGSVDKERGRPAETAAAGPGRRAGAAPRDLRHEAFPVAAQQRHRRCERPHGARDRRFLRRLGGQAAHQAHVPAQRRRGVRHRFELHQLRDQGRAGAALQRAQHPGRRGRGGAARPRRPRGARAARARHPSPCRKRAASSCRRARSFPPPISPSSSATRATATNPCPTACSTAPGWTAPSRSTR